MQKLWAALILSVFILSTIAIAEDNSTNNTGRNLCESVTCTDSTATCPDGFTARCSNSCDSSTGQCSQCVPSCSGHEANFCDTAQCGSKEKACPDGFRSVCQKTCGNAAKQCIDCEPSCAGHESTSTPQQPTNQTTTCPTPPQQPTCAQDEYVYTKYENNCIAGYECKKPSNQTPSPLPACSAPPPQPACGAGEYVAAKYDSNKCIVSYECRKTAPTCPLPSCAAPPPNCRYTGSVDEKGCYTCGTLVCEGEKRDSGPRPGICGNNICEGDEYKTCQKDCETTTGPGKCGDSICDVGEDASSCPSDCRVPRQSCPLTIQCSDGSQAVCKQDGNSCTCDQCPVANLPPNCRQETNEKGFVIVRCEEKQECRQFAKEDVDACRSKGGTPVFRGDFSGCKRFECSFGEEGNTLFGPRQACPAPTDAKAGIDKCFSLGLRGVVKFENGCQVPTCVEKEENKCRELTDGERTKLKSDCGDRIAKIIDSNGCPQYFCQEENACQKDLPEDAYKACSAKGGEIAVKRDQNSCVVFAECLRKGNIESSYVEESTASLEPAELLQIALRLEQLKVELDKLAQETKNIAEYYKSTGSNEAERFSRVSDMFNAAKDKVDGIKEKIRKNADSMDREGLTEIRRDTRYVKNVIIKDILYLMLSNGDEVKKIKDGSETDCGSDGQCFDEAFRLCKPIKFFPEGEGGPEVTITGLEDGKCVMKAMLADDKGPSAGTVPGGPPWEMTCRIEKYALGAAQPEKDIFPYCEGSMVELIKKYGTGGGGAPGIPGKCSGNSCKEYCSRGPAEAKECLDKFGSQLPEEAKAGLRSIAKEKPQQASTADRFGGSREFGQPPGFGEVSLSEPKFTQPAEGTRTTTSTTTRASAEPSACVGCLSNGVCDPGECSGCPDCSRR